MIEDHDFDHVNGAECRGKDMMLPQQNPPRKRTQWDDIVIEPSEDWVEGHRDKTSVAGQPCRTPLATAKWPRT